MVCVAGHVSLAKLLIENAADLSIRDGDALTPLHTACVFGYDDIVKLLVDGGADINIPDSRGDMPIHTACSEGQWPMVEVLVGIGADVNVQTAGGDGCGYTPLHRACENGYGLVVESLIAFGADINKQDNRGGTPLHMACEQRWRVERDEHRRFMAETNLFEVSRRDEYEGQEEAGPPLFPVLIHAGADTRIRDARGRLASELLVDPQDRVLFETKVREYVEQAVAPILK
jgi:ankyrin repeat protein